MTLVFESVLHVNSSSSSAAISTTPVSVALVGGDTTSTGSTVVVAFLGAGTQGVTTAPSGWVKVGPTVGSVGRLTAFRRGPTEGLVSGESSWSFTPSSGTANPLVWVVMELAGIDPDLPVDAVATTAIGLTTTSGTTFGPAAPQSTTYDGMVVCLHGSDVTAGGVPTTWSGHTGGFVEQAEQSSNDGVDAVDLSVSVLPVQTLGTFGATATNSGTLSATNNGLALPFVLSAQGARKAANVQVFAGFEWGTAAGLATGTAGNTIFDAVGGTPAIVSTNPHSGSYCLECASTAAAEYTQWTSSGALGSVSNQFYAVARVCILFPSALPSGDVDLFNMAAASGTTITSQHVTLRYRSSSQQLGLQVRDPVGAVNGTEQLSATTVVADTWYAIDVRLSQPSTAWTADWQIDGTDQTQATVTATAASGVGAISLGWFGSTTATVRYDDVVFSRTQGHYPLGDMRVYPLAVDPAGTLTISGTTANFQTYSANGTMAAWNATTARVAISEIPPTIGASADGIAQITAATTDYVEIPMTTRDGAANGEAVRAVRMYAAGWGAGSPAAATIGFRAWNGSAETILLSAADPTFTNSTTTPGWVAKMYKPVSGWTQAQLDALAFRVGFSGDATPDIGIHNLMAEVCMRTGQSQTLFGDVASAAVDPDSAGVINVTVTAPNPGTGDTALYYEVNGSPTTVPITAGTTAIQAINAADAPTVNYIALYPPPEPDPAE